MSAIPPGTVRCVLCQTVISFRQNDKSEFELHLQLKHRVNTDTDIILAICLMDEEEVEVVKTVMFIKLQNSTEEAQRPLEVGGENCETEMETVVKTECSEENITLEEDPLVSPIGDVLDEKETVLREVTDEDLERSKYFSVQKYPVLRPVCPALVEEFNVEESFLPGWRIRTRQVFTDSKSSGVVKRKCYLTPDKKWRIQSCLGVLEYLRLQGRQETELSSLAEQMGVDRKRFIKLCSNSNRVLGK